MTVTVATDAGANPPAPGMVRLKPDATSGPDGARWLMGALHMHTLHSDGTVSPAGGCGCTTASTSESRAPWLLLGLVLVASRRRQRRLAA